MKIYSKGGILLAEIADAPYTGAFMGERFISCNVKSEKPIEFLPEDYMDFRGERFVLDYTPTAKKISSAGSVGDAFQYDLKFVSLKHELEKCLFLDVVLNDNNIHYTGLSDVQVFGDAKVLADRILANLNRIYKGENQWTIEVLKQTDAQNISLSDSNCWDAVSLFKSLFNLNFTVTGRNIKVGTVGKLVDHVFKYGSGNGLTEIVRTAVSGEAVVTRLKAYGGNRNLPRDYNKTGNVPESQYITNLMLPGYTETLIDYVDSDNIPIYGIREAVFKNEEIYPSISGMTAEEIKAAGVTTYATGRLDEIVYAEAIKREDQATFNLWIKDIGFDIKKYLTPTTALISMRDGNLGGYEFEITNVVTDSTHTGAKYKLTLNRNQDDNFILPDVKTYIKPGDHFVLLEIYMPDVYVKAAEQRLLTKAKEYLAEYDHVKATYSINMDKVFMAYHPTIGDTIYEGDLIRVVDEDLKIDREIIIQNLTIKTGGTVPEYEVTLSDNPVSTTLDRVQDNITEIEQNVTANKVDGVKEARRRAIELQLLKANIFDPDGNIKDTFLQTMMLQVGANSMNYQMGKTTARPKLNNMSFTNTSINLGADDLIHFAYGSGEEAASTWHIATPFSGSGLIEDKTYFVAIKASRDNLTAEWIVDENTYGSESVPGYYIFNFGILSAVTDGARLFSETRGNIYAYGDELSAGLISSIDRYSWFNLNTGDFQLYNKKTGQGLQFKDGALTLGTFNPETGKFSSSISKIENDITETSQQAADAQSKANEAERKVQESLEYITGTLEPAIIEANRKADGVVSSYSEPYSPTLENYPAKDWIAEDIKNGNNARKEAALGDSFVNITPYIDDETTPDTGKMWRWTKINNVYLWDIVAQSDSTKALKELAIQGSLLQGKSSTFLLKPVDRQVDGYCYRLSDAWILESDTVKPPYKKGEMLNAVSGNTVFNAADWEKRDLSADNAVDNLQIGDVNIINDSLINETSSDYGFGHRSTFVEAGKTYTFSANGRIDQQALSDGKKLYICIYKSEWDFQKDLDYASLSDLTRRVTFESPFTGMLLITSYLYPSGGSRIGKVTSNWYKLVEGNKTSDQWSPSLSDKKAEIEEAKAEANYGKLFLRGTGENNNADRQFILNNDGVNRAINSRGLNLIIIRRSDLTVLESVMYDIFDNGAGTTPLIDKLNSLDSSVIVTLTSFDSSYNTTQALIDAISRCGGSGSFVPFSYSRIPYAFVGIPGIGKGTGIEVFTTIATDAPYAEISTQIINGIPSGMSTTASVLAKQAINDASNAQVAADRSQTTANDAVLKLTDIASDSKLTPSEKQTTKKEWDVIESEKSVVVSQGANYGIDTSSYTSKFDILNTYVTPLIANLSSTSDIVGGTFRAMFKDYYDSRTALLKAVSDKAKQLSDSAQAAAEKAKQDALDAKAKADEAKLKAEEVNFLKNAFKSNVSLDNGVVMAGGIFVENSPGSNVISAGLAGYIPVGQSDYPMIFAGSNGVINANLAKFRVYKNGKIYASDAEITGKIIATSGKIGNFEINEGNITSNDFSFSSGRLFFDDGFSRIALGQMFIAYTGDGIVEGANFGVITYNPPDSNSMAAFFQIGSTIMRIGTQENILHTRGSILLETSGYSIKIKGLPKISNTNGWDRVLVNLTTGQLAYG